MDDEPKGGLRPLGSVPPEYRRRGYRHTASWACYGAFFAIVMGQGPFVIRQLGGSALQSLLVNLGQAVPLVFAVLWVPFVQRRNPVRLTGLLLGLGGLLMVFSGLSPGRWTLVAVLTAGMLLVTVSRPTLGVALRQIYPDRWRGKLLSLPNISSMLARMACLVAVGWLLRADISLYRVVFPAAGVCLLLGGFLFRGIKGSRGDHRPPDEPDPSPARHVRRSLRATLANRTLVAFLVGYFVTACGGVAFSNVLPIFARDELALTTQQWGLARALNMGAMLASFYFWGAFMDRFGAPLTVVVSWTLIGAMFAGMFLVRSWPAFLALMAVGGLFSAGNLIAFFPVVMHFTESSETIRGMGLHFTLWGIRWVLMVGLVIAVVDAALFPMRYVFVLSAALVAAGTAVMALVWRRDRAAASRQFTTENGGEG